MNTKALNETTLNLLSGIDSVDERDAVADLVERAPEILRQEWYRLMGDSMTPETERRLMNAIGAQWTR